MVTNTLEVVSILSLIKFMINYTSFSKHNPGTSCHLEFSRINGAFTRWLLQLAIFLDQFVQNANSIQLGSGIRLRPLEGRNQTFLSSGPKPHANWISLYLIMNFTREQIRSVGFMAEFTLDVIFTTFIIGNWSNLLYGRNQTSIPIHRHKFHTNWISH